MDMEQPEQPMSPGSRLVLGVLCFVGLAGCYTEQTSAQVFCDTAIPILLKDDIGDDPAALRAQMLSLKEAVPLLATAEEEDDLVALIDPLLAQLDLAVQGHAENGWSSSHVVAQVESLCDFDLIAWTVQP
jgi:hypothetical protein